jgi:SAM-dependent methyltransferase
MWYENLFKGKWANFWVEKYEEFSERTMDEVEFLKGILVRGVTLDLCCGAGRHSIPLSSYGDIISLDLSRDLLSTLKTRGGKNVNPIRGDVRKLPFKEESFNNVINVFTSFGYFGDEENELVLQEISRILKPQGIFVLDMANPIWVIRNFREIAWDESTSCYVLERRSLDWSSKRMKNQWILVDKEKGKIDELSFDHRLYDLNELKNLLTKVGLEVIDVFGSFKKEEFQEASSRRIVIVAKKYS